MTRIVQGEWLSHLRGRLAGSLWVARPRIAIGALLCFAICGLLAACAGTGRREGIREDREFVLIPPPPETPRVQFLAAYTSNTDVLPPISSFRRFVLGEREGRELGKPYGVAIHDGQILVCDARAAIVAVFDLRARTVEILGGDPNGRLKKPLNIAVDEDGTRYIADADLDRVMVYDRNNRFVRALGDPEAWAPTDVALAGELIYVSDKKNGQVVVLEKETGRELNRFSRLGAGEGELFFPTNIDVGGDGSVYVTDTGNARVLKFDPQGKLLRQFGSLGRRHGQFVRPKGVAVDREDRVYVVDAASEVVQIFDSEGDLLLFFGGPGNQPGGLNIPAKVVIDYDNVDLFADRVAPGFDIEYLILVTSQFGLHKVNVFGFLKKAEIEAPL